MPRLFPRPDGKRGVNMALLAGCIGALILAGIDVYGIAVRALQFQQYSEYSDRQLETVRMIVAIGLTLVPLIGAWRFAIGKGMAWGCGALLLVLMPVLGDVLIGEAVENDGWIILRLALAAMLIAGIRGAWLARGIEPPTDYADVFE
jgi:hypothetical protein